MYISDFSYYKELMECHRFVTYLSNDPRIAGAFCLQDAIVTEMALLVANLL